MRLPEVKPEVFAVHVGWLYTGEVEPLQQSTEELLADCESQEARDFRTRACNQLLDCFALGDMVQDINFRNAIVDTFMEGIEEGGGPLVPTKKAQSTCGRLFVTIAS